MERSSPPKLMWIYDVLIDLRAFSAANDLPRTTEELDRALPYIEKELVERLGASIDPLDPSAPQLDHQSVDAVAQLEQFRKNRNKD